MSKYNIHRCYTAAEQRIDVKYNLRPLSFLSIYIIITTLQLRTTINVPYAFFGLIVCWIHVVLSDKKKCEPLDKVPVLSRSCKGVFTRGREKSAHVTVSSWVSKWA